jgi:glucosamine kinase
LQTLDSGTRPGPLVESVLRELDADGPGRDGQHDRVIQVVNSRPGVQLSALAPLVTAAYRAGDPEAHSIVERAAAALLATLALIRDPAESTPIVLAGSLAGDASPVGAELRTLLAARFTGAVLPARNGVGGAAWLALATLDPALATSETHTRLTS